MTILICANTLAIPIFSACVDLPLKSLELLHNESYAGASMDKSTKDNYLIELEDTSLR